jgi:DNA-binding transcriptional LysR family regulator
MQSPLDLGDLQFFLALYRAGSLSAAGRALGVYPSTVSRRLAALEASLDTLLFQRTPDGFVPTASAEEMVEAAEIIERQSHLITERLSGEAAALRGRVRVAVTTQFSEHFLCGHLQKFREAYPEIEVEVVTSANFADIARGEAELAVRFAPVERGAPVPDEAKDTVTARSIDEVGIRVYVSRAYLERTGKSPDDDPASFDAVVPLAPWLPGLAWMRTHMAACRVSVRTDDLSSSMAAVRAGMGATVLPAFIAGAFDDLVPLTQPGRVATRMTWLLMPRDLRRVARVRAFAEFAFDLLRAHKELFAGD